MFSISLSEIHKTFKIKFFIYCHILFLFSYKVNAQTLSENDIREINESLRFHVSTQGVPGAVMMVANKRNIIYKSVSGFNSISKNDTLQIDDIFDIASMTKAITSVVIMQLYEQGRIGLDDPAQKYLPDIANLQVIDQFNANDTIFTTKPVAQPITIKQLLTHTSGMGYPFCNDTLAMIKAKKKNDQSSDSYLSFPLLHQPGIVWAYGTSTDVLGDIIEAITDTTLDEYYYQKIFKPLGMTNTFFTVPQDKYSRLASYYQDVNGKFQEHPSHGTEKPTIKGGEGLYSTAEDYTKFLQMLLNKGTFNGVKILNRKTVDKMIKNQIGNLFVQKQEGAIPKLSNSFPSRVDEDKYGFGFVLRTATDYNIYQRNPGSYDWAGLYNTYYWVDTLAGITAVCMMQVLPFYDSACINVLNNFEKTLYRHLNKTTAIFSFLRKEELPLAISSKKRIR